LGWEKRHKDLVARQSTAEGDANSKVRLIGYGLGVDRAFLEKFEEPSRKPNP
jgi:hypothetical protein